MKRLFYDILWRLGVPIQCRARNEYDKSWSDMAKKDVSVTTKWDFENWDYRLRPRNFDERFKCL